MLVIEYASVFQEHRGDVSASKPAPATTALFRNAVRYIVSLAGARLPSNHSIKLRARGLFSLSR